MKRILKTFTLCFLLASCSNYDYTPYYEAKGMKGTEVYCWEIEENTWRCGVMLGTNRNKTLDELLWMQNDLPCTLKKMNKILTTYSDEERQGITIFEIPYPMTEEIYNTSFLNYNSENLPFLVSELGLTNK